MTTDPVVDVHEASIAGLAAALAAGSITSVELVAAHLTRIGAYDRQGTALNAVPVLSPEVFADAAASDARRAAGASLGPLDGIPYTAKASYRARGLPVTAGSPALRELVATEDAWSIGALRAAGAVLVGLTTMPPMADGGMQRGVDGRAESPYDPAYLAAGYLSGSSNGSGVATTAGYAVFGLGEETWSSGRSPASNNALVAYTPSRGVISVRGNWPLFATMDVVVPHTRSVPDLLVVLDALVGDDPQTRGDFWREQPFVALPRASEVRPADYATLADPQALAGVRLGVPRMYLGADSAVTVRASVVDLWTRARADLEALGAEVVEVDFPAVTRYGQPRDFLPADLPAVEYGPMMVAAWDDFLRANADPRLGRLADVDGALLFPHPAGTIVERTAEDVDLVGLVERAHAGRVTLADVPELEHLVTGLEEARRVDLEEWLDGLGLAGLVFPANGDVGREDAERDPAAHAHAMADGVGCSHGNAVIRHLGIPTVTVPMGVLADLGMPVGLTFAGRGWSDSTLLSWAFAFEAATARRVPPPRAPALPTDRIPVAAPDVPVGPASPDDPAGRSGLAPPDPRSAARPRPDAGPDIVLAATVEGSPAHPEVVVRGSVTPADIAVSVTIGGREVPVLRDGAGFTGRTSVPVAELARRPSEWRGPVGVLVVAWARTTSGACGGSWAVAGG